MNAKICHSQGIRRNHFFIPQMALENLEHPKLDVEVNTNLGNRNPCSGELALNSLVIFNNQFTDKFS